MQLIESVLTTFESKPTYYSIGGLGLGYSKATVLEWTTSVLELVRKERRTMLSPFLPAHSIVGILNDID